jgi:hypothetical protein
LSSLAFGREWNVRGKFYVRDFAVQSAAVLSSGFADVVIVASNTVANAAVSRVAVNNAGLQMSAINKASRGNWTTAIVSVPIGSGRHELA